jgi:hypothetical protein
MKKGQMQIQETWFVIAIVVIILIVLLGVFFQYQFKSIENLEKEYQEYKFQSLISFLPSMPELRYSKLGKDEESIDFYKAKAFSGISGNSYYRGLFGYKKIVLSVDNENIVLYDRRLGGSKSSRKISSPVSVYKNGRFYVGVLEVIKYE